MTGLDHRYDIGESTQVTSMCGRDLNIEGNTVSDGSNVYSIEDVEIRDYFATNCHVHFLSTKVSLRCLLPLRPIFPSLNSLAAWLPTKERWKKDKDFLPKYAIAVAGGILRGHAGAVWACVPAR